MTQDLAPGAAIQMVGSTPALATTGAAYTATSGTITTATSTVATGNVGLAGNVTVYIFGTYAGVTVNFEVSPDNTNWFTWPMQREQTGVVESSPVLASNAAASWTIDAPGFNFFRVRASAWTSGTANVVINPGTYPITPVVSAVMQQPSSKVTFALTAPAGVTPVTTEALMSLTAVRGVTAGAAATSQTVTTGKTLRITSITVSLVSSAAAILRGSLSLRARASGALVVGDPFLWRTDISTNNALANGTGSLSASIPDGIDLPSGTVFGVSNLASAATGFWELAINGYEF
jgi:hypothetical protein